jgi:hypothetical protein
MVFVSVFFCRLSENGRKKLEEIVKRMKKKPKKSLVAPSFSLPLSAAAFFCCCAGFLRSLFSP